MVKSIKTVMAKTPQNENNLRAFFFSFLKFLREDFSIKKHLPVYFFTGIMVFVLYYFGFEKWKRSLDLSASANFIFLTSAYIISFVPVLFWVMYSEKKRIAVRGVLIALLFISLYAVCSSWSPYHSFTFFSESIHHYWYRKFLSNAVPFVIFFFAFIIFWKSFFKGTGRFMWTGSEMGGLKIIYPLLIVVVVIVFIGSRIGDFGNDYPVFEIKKASGNSIVPYLQLYSFEAAYALDFYVVEILFRGVLVLGLLKYFGNNVLLPMASLYVFIHYGKPMAETISSFFGAYLLGYLAIYTRSVLPGTVLHVTLAWTMEVVGALVLVSK